MCASAGSPKEEYETQYKRSRAMLENKEYVYTEHSTIKSATGKRMVYNKVVRCKSTDSRLFADATESTRCAVVVDEFGVPIFLVMALNVRDHVLASTPA